MIIPADRRLRKGRTGGARRPGRGHSLAVPLRFCRHNLRHPPAARHGANAAENKAMAERWISLADAAKRMKVSISTVGRWIRAGRI